MLLDNDGDAVFIYTPPSRRSLERSRARDPRHAAKLYKRAEQDTSGRWAVFHFASHANPFISEAALGEITGDMTDLAYRQEILASDEEDMPGALWTRALIDQTRVTALPPGVSLARIVVAVDPSATSGGDACGIVVAGLGTDNHGYVLEDNTMQGSPAAWASEAVAAYHRHRADRLIAESNNGGEMVSTTISTVYGAPPVTLIHASRGKLTRAEPIAARYEQLSVHHFGTFPDLEDEMVQWVVGMDSPNRMDALVWCLTELLLNGGPAFNVNYIGRLRR